MEFERTLTPGMTGADVRHMKDALLRLGYLHASTHDTFGSDTAKAVERFQREHDLVGVIDARTWAAIVDAIENAPKPGEYAMPTNIGTAAQTAIAAALDGVSKTRVGIVLDALQYAYDPAVPGEYPHSLYIRGGNLYNTDLTPNVITLARIASGAKRQPQYYDGGRKEMMEQAVTANPSITGADCSGGVVGLLRHAGVVKSGFDLSADGFYGASSNYQRIKKEELRPGDLVHKQGHIGIYVGGGYVVEWAGGAYGCQLTKVDDRRVYNFVTKKTGRMSAWQHFLRPKFY